MNAPNGSILLKSRQGRGTLEIPFDNKTRTALEASLKGLGIGYARTHGNFRVLACGLRRERYRERSRQGAGYGAAL